MNIPTNTIKYISLTQRDVNGRDKEQNEKGTTNALLKRREICVAFYAKKKLILPMEKYEKQERQKS